MKLSQLRQRVLDNMAASVSADVFGVGQPEGVINDAYGEIVSELEQMAPRYNISPIVPTLTTPGSSVAREYALSEAPFSPAVSDVRKIVDCARIYGDEPIDVPIVPFVRRHARTGRAGVSGYAGYPRDPSYFSAPARAPLVGVYFYRDGNGVWYLGFPTSDPPVSTVFQVRYLASITLLAADDDEPMQVPSEWHYVIALKAAIVGMTWTQRDVRGLQALYAEALVKMRADLADFLSPGRVTPL